MRRSALVEADAVEKTAEQHLLNAAADAVVAVQPRRDDADVLLDVPDRLAAAAPPAEQVQVIAVGLRVVASDHLEQARLALARRRCAWWNGGTPNVFRARAFSELTWPARPLWCQADRILQLHADDHSR